MGQGINLASLANDTGVSAATIRNWLSVLKVSYVVFELPPFFENVRKRVIKSPKVFFTDGDLVVADVVKGVFTPVEIKSAGTFSVDFIKGFEASAFSIRSLLKISGRLSSDELRHLHFPRRLSASV